MLRCTIIFAAVGAFTAIVALGMSSAAMAHHGGGGHSGGGHSGASHSGGGGYSGGGKWGGSLGVHPSAVHPSTLSGRVRASVKAPVAHAQSHNQFHAGFGPLYDNAYNSCRIRVPTYYGWQWSNVCAGYRP